MVLAGAKDHTLREQLRDSPHFAACEEFCLKWDQVIGCVINFVL